MSRMIQTRRWNDPPGSDEGWRILVTRYRPRGVRKDQETWDEWMPNLGPSKALHAAYFGKGRVPLSWGGYRSGYLTEMHGQKAVIEELAARVLAGKRITLLCSSHCTRENRCHRTLLRDLIERAMDRLASGAAEGSSEGDPPSEGSAGPGPDPERSGTCR